MTKQGLASPASLFFELFLSKAERDYLIANDNKFNHGYDRVIRSRLNKNVQQFVSQELPLLIEKGYVTEFRNVTENSNALVAQPGREKGVHERQQNHKALEGIRTHDLRFKKP